MKVGNKTVKSNETKPINNKDKTNNLRSTNLRYKPLNTSKIYPLISQLQYSSCNYLKVG